MAKIGPSFVDELQDAGLAGVAMAWAEDGWIGFAASVPVAERDAVMGVLAAHDPTAMSRAELLEAKRAADVQFNLPSWTVVEAEIGRAASLDEAKAILLKLARIVYWNAKDAEV